MSLRRYQTIGFAGAFAFVLSVLIQCVIMPLILNSQIKKQIALKKGWPMREIWSKLPFVIECHMYVFNVTNHREIDMGAKPIVRELGPFVYDVYQEKTEQVDHEEDDSVSYVLRNVYHFNPRKSRGLSDQLEVYFPHTYIMAASTGVIKDNGPSAASFTSRSVDSVLNRPESLFYKVNVKTLLFDGFAIHCAGVDDYFGKLTCNLLEERYFDFTLRKQGDTYYTSMFGSLNGTYVKQHRLRIRRGIENVKDLGRVIEMNGMKNLSIWKDDRCNAFAGTDSTIFPPGLKKNGDDIWVTNPLVCRTLKLTYDSEVKFAGLKLLRYTVDVGTDGDHVPAEKCYCIAPDRCLKRGMFEMFRCINVPVIMSNPHFYNADPYYLGRVDALKPDRGKHLSYVDFDPLTGSPVRARSRAQVNMELLKIDTFRLTRNHTYAMLPMVWMEEIVVLPDFFLERIATAHGQIRVVKLLVCALMIGGMAMCAASAYLKYRSGKVTELDLKPTTPSEEGNDPAATVLPSAGY